MPIFEFECKKCGKTFETLMGSNEKEKPPCPDCGSKKTKRMLSAFSSGSSNHNTSCGPAGSA
ncbi:MAG: zinc ribbon domain-containing protein [Deltaproteobacteria bacterium]|nr:zinc ribbon domain-containing protein [Deltaproteobacteria bacterium]